MTAWRSTPAWTGRRWTSTWASTSSGRCSSSDRRRWIETECPSNSSLQLLTNRLSSLSFFLSFIHSFIHSFFLSFSLSLTLSLPDSYRNVYIFTRAMWCVVSSLNCIFDRSGSHTHSIVLFNPPFTPHSSTHTTHSKLQISNSQFLTCVVAR